MPAFDRGEERAFKLLFGERKTAAEASRILAQEGITMSPEQLRRFKKTAYELLVREERDERLSELMLESFDRIKVEWEGIVDKTKALLEKMEASNKTYGQLEVIREMREQLVVAMKRLGELSSGLQSVTLKKTTINIGDYMEAFRQLREKEFEEMFYEDYNGKLVINKPSPELLDDYWRWKRRRAKKMKAIDVGNK